MTSANATIAGLIAAVALASGATMLLRTSARATGANVDVQGAHAQGTCGTLGPGSGLRDNKGWVVSMLPGHHEFRTRRGGSVYVTVARQTVLEADAGRLYYIVVEGASADTVLEWKTPKSDWAAIPKAFLYPPQNVTK